MNKEFGNGLVNIGGNAIEQVIMLADKNGIDRDEAVRSFGGALMLTCLTGTFKNFKVGGNENE